MWCIHTTHLLYRQFLCTSVALLFIFLPGMAYAAQDTSSDSPKVELVSDSFEDDDSKELSSFIGLIGPNQQHNLHVAGDQDWARFYATPENIVSIETKNLGSDSDTFLELYDALGNRLDFADDTNPEEERGEVLKPFQPDEEGLYFIRVTYSPEAIFPDGPDADTSYTLNVREETGGIFTGSLLVTVNQKGSEIPITNAVVELLPITQRITENVDGVYAFPIIPTPASYVIRVSAEGFADTTLRVSIESGAIEETSISLNPTSRHAADTDGNARLDLSEVLRIIQLYNASVLHCDGTTEDSYQVGPGDQSCERHTADYQLPAFFISLSELLRQIQLFSLGTIQTCVESEDGFCPFL